LSPLPGGAPQDHDLIVMAQTKVARIGKRYPRTRQPAKAPAPGVPPGLLARLVALARRLGL
jgi:hypothetical protein